MLVCAPEADEVLLETMYLSIDPAMRSWMSEGPGYQTPVALGEVMLESQELTADALRATDCVLIVTNHPGYNWDWVVRSSPLVVDTRNATKGIPVNGHTLFKL